MQEQFTRVKTLRVRCALTFEVTGCACAVRLSELLAGPVRSEETMARKRFRWTRRRYEKARELARFMGRHMIELPDQMPDLLRRYLDLWERYPQRDDE